MQIHVRSSAGLFNYGWRHRKLADCYSTRPGQKRQQKMRKNIMLRKSGLSVIGALTIVALSACTQTSHSTKPANLGKAISSAAMEALIDQPGPIELETVVGADWIADFSGLLNLKDPKAVAAGLRDHEEPIQIYAHLARHPTQGFFMVDTGVSKRLVADPASLGVGWVLRTFAKIERMQVRQDTLSVIKSEGIPLNGVFMTHLHLDHISGMPDVPKDVRFTPVPVNPNIRASCTCSCRGWKTASSPEGPRFRSSSSRKIRMGGSKG
ncbi:MBL fold metallo-hydrolase [Bradyrhizobium liaoningense]|uniref:MBL fold metallo-hydrolase n=1 Tax=Bradyrhizobium liaoningense TaxID=43992 RepID=UPI001BA88C63|nr:MBL fold metallo-hydrolase [Bradyrhizobium liaoningense]MBR0858961.1 MBL fold metallo-hydrolase [Bradyrhizobium liaoningense]